MPAAPRLTPPDASRCEAAGIPEGAVWVGNQVWTFQDSWLWNGNTRTWSFANAIGPQLGSGQSVGDPYTGQPGPPYAVTRVQVWTNIGWQLADLIQNW